MFYRTIFMCLLGFVLVKLEETESMEITFEIRAVKDINQTPTLICDHDNKNKDKHKYTVLEGNEFKIITKYDFTVNHFICSDYTDNKKLFNYVDVKKDDIKHNTTAIFRAVKTMGTLWNCTMLAHLYNTVIRPRVQYKSDEYSAAYCYFKIHVRQKESPQTILVNNMVLQAVRTDLSEKDVDFIAEYQYADGDRVDVTCANFLILAPLTMEYVMAGQSSDNSTMADLSSEKAMRLVAQLHSGHDGSFMICTNTEKTDYTKVMVRFIMGTTFNMASININGMILRPKRKENSSNNYYEIHYKYSKNQLIHVVCEVQRGDLKLVELDTDTQKKLSSYKQTNKKIEMSFNAKDIPLTCFSDYITGGSAEQIRIYFTEGNFPIQRYPLDVKLPSKGITMELYDDAPLKVIFYEFKVGETLQLKCGPLLLPSAAGPVQYLQLKDSGTCIENDCHVIKTLTLTHKDENTEKVCYLREQKKEAGHGVDDQILRKIRVILRERILTTTTSTTTTTGSTVISKAPGDNNQISLIWTSDVKRLTSEVHIRDDDDAKPHTVISSSSVPSASLEPGKKDNDGEISRSNMAVIAGAVGCVIIICISTVIIKLRKRNHSQGGPHDRNYENLSTPSETSIPAYPPQWESNYAVPLDRRTEDTVYSVPCQEPVLYATPTPKTQRNKKQKPVDPTYAVLEVPAAQGRKNNFKETEDPNYSEVYANRKEQCYAKVLPKSVRNKMEQDNNPYSYVTNESPYANTVEPEPMYCEPAKAQGAEYANLNSAHYVNSNAQEYVEPTYCEPQKLSI